MQTGGSRNLQFLRSINILLVDEVDDNITTSLQEEIHLNCQGQSTANAVGTAIFHHWKLTFLQMVSAKKHVPIVKKRMLFPKSSILTSPL